MNIFINIFHRKPLMRRRIEKAGALFRKERFKRALGAYNAVIRSAGATISPEYYYFQGLCLFALGNFKESDEAMGKAINTIDNSYEIVSKKNWQIGESYLIKAGIRFIQGNYKEAIELFDKEETQGLAPDSPWKFFPNFYKIRKIRNLRKKQVKKGTSLAESIKEFQKADRELPMLDFEAEKRIVREMNQKDLEYMDKLWLNKRIKELKIDLEKHFGELTDEKKKYWVELLERTKRKLVEEDDPILTMEERNAKQILWQEEGWDMYISRDNPRYNKPNTDWELVELPPEK